MIIPLIIGIIIGIVIIGTIIYFIVKGAKGAKRTKR